MTNEEYLEISQCVEIVVVSDLGKEVKGLIKSKTRNTLEEIKAVCENCQIGKIEFTDVAFFDKINMNVVQIKLYYSGILVGFRKIGTFSMRYDDICHDTLEVTYSVEILSKESHLGGHKGRKVKISLI